MRDLIKKKCRLSGFLVLQEVTKMAVERLSLVKEEVAFVAGGLVFRPEKHLS